MREFMTRLSDYWSERREDPERKEDRLSLAVIAAVALVIAVLLLLVWWGYSMHGKKEKDAAEKAKMLQQSEASESLSKARNLESMEAEAQGLVMATYEEKMKEYLSESNTETLRQEYLNDTKALTDKVRDLENTMAAVEKKLSETAEKYSESDASQKATISALQTSVKNAVASIRQLEGRLADLSETVQTTEREKLAGLQAQMAEVRAEAERARTEISGLRQSVASLKTEDEKLWRELSAVERNLDKAIGQNLDAIDKELDKLAKNDKRLETDMKETVQQMEERDKALENKMDAISKDALSYRYEQRSNTLYLMPAGKEVTR